jgi:hypothetical protein
LPVGNERELTSFYVADPSDVGDVCVAMDEINAGGYVRSSL